MFYYIRKSISFTVKYHILIFKIFLYFKTMCSYKKYIFYSILYCIDLKSFKYTKYVLYTSHKCDLVIFKVK